MTGIDEQVTGGAAIEEPLTEEPLTDEVLAAVEAVLAVADRPVAEAEIALALGVGVRLVEDACRDLAAGGRPRLPRGTEATVRAGWFPEA